MYTSQTELFSIHPSNPPLHDGCLHTSQRSTEIQESILVVDDEPSLVDLAVEFFKMSGINANGFTNAGNAITWYESHFDEVALIFLDMKMPIMSGQQCFYELKDINCDAQIVLMSGFVEKHIIIDLLHNGAVRFIQKPCDYLALIDWTLERLGRAYSSTSH